MITDKEIRDFKVAQYGTVNAKTLREDHGVRIRKSKLGEGVWDLSVTYFYRSQANLRPLIQELAKHLDRNLEILNTLGLPPNSLEDGISYEQNSWPKESWATISVKDLMGH